MFAVIKTGGKQYRVQEGDILDVEKLNKEEGQKITFDQVLLVEDNKETLIGTPLLKKAQVKGVILENFRDDKIIIFKKKRRKQYKKKRGHRQDLSRVKIEKILSGAEKPAVKKPPAKKAEEKEAVKKPAAKPRAKKAEVKKEAPVKKAAAKPVKKAEPKKPKAQEKAAAPAKKPSAKAKAKAKASGEKKSSVKKEK